MIPEIFLMCAMALPPESVTPAIDRNDVSVIQMLLSFPPAEIRPKSGRILLIATPAAWALTLRKTGFLAYRVVFLEPSLPWDVVASALSLPIQRESIAVTITNISAGSTPWTAMRTMQEAARSVEMGGYLIFDPGRCFMWLRFLPQYGFWKLPLMWHTKQVWQKIRQTERRELTEMYGSA